MSAKNAPAVLRKLKLPSSIARTIQKPQEAVGKTMIDRIDEGMQRNVIADNASELAPMVVTLFEE